MALDPLTVEFQREKPCATIKRPQMTVALALTSTSTPHVSGKALRIYVICGSSISVASGVARHKPLRRRTPESSRPARQAALFPALYKVWSHVSRSLQAVSQRQGIGLAFSFCHWSAVFLGSPKSLVSLLTTPWI